MRLTWNQGSADDYVDLPTLLGEKGHLSLNELFRHLLGITSDSLSGLTDVYFQRLCPEGLELLQGCRPDRKEGQVIVKISTNLSSLNLQPET